MVVVGLTYLGIAIAALLVGVSAYQNYMLLRSLGLGRNGTMLFWQKLTLKLWVGLLLAYILTGTVIGGFPAPARRWINLGMVALLIAQAAWESGVTYRWRRNRARGRR